MTPPIRARGFAAATVSLAMLASACGAARWVTLPSGSGAPFPEFAEAYGAATAECRIVTTMTVRLGVSGRAGTTRLRGRIDAGLAAPAQIRLEGFPPLNFGAKPFFIMVARGHEATLLLPRDARVLRGSPPAAIVEALAGVPLGPAELRGVLTGCGLISSEASAGRLYPNGWAAIDVAGGTTVFLRQIEGQWRVAAARRAALTIHYADFTSGRAATVRVWTGPADGSAGAADLTLKMSDVELNVPLESAVFDLDVPRDAIPLTLDELRRAGPLGGGSE